jgi:hypothetical protein
MMRFNKNLIRFPSAGWSLQATGGFFYFDKRGEMISDITDCCIIFQIIFSPTHFHPGNNIKDEHPVSHHGRAPQGFRAAIDSSNHWRFC